MKIRPLGWQREAVSDYKIKYMKGQRDYVLIAGTGCGKTYCGSFMADFAVQDHRKDGRNPFLLIAVPNRAIKRGWVKALQKFNYKVSGNAKHVLDAALDGMVITYASMKTLLPVISRLGKQMIVVFDEFHHLEETQEWGTTAQQYLDDRLVVRRLFLSGTPWHETGKLGMVRYVEVEGGLVVCHDYKYTYGDNLAEEDDSDRNVVKVRINRYHSEAERNVYDKDTHEYLRTDQFDTRTSVKSDPITPHVDVNGSEHRSLDAFPVLRQMLAEANEQLWKCRKEEGMPWAGGMVIAKSVKDAEIIVEHLRRLPGASGKGGQKALLVTSEDAKALELINGVRGRGGFINNHQDDYPQWIVAVEMISEGVDIPRLKVGVDLTNRLTLMHILQRWGRFLRRVRRDESRPELGFFPKQYAYIYILKHAMLSQVADMLEKEMQKAYKEKEGGGDQPESNTYGKTERVTGEHDDAVFSGESFASQVAHFAQWLWSQDCDGIRSMSDSYGQVLKTAAWTIKQIERGNAQYPSGYEEPTPYDERGDISSDDKPEDETYDEQRARLTKEKQALIKWFVDHAPPYSLQQDRGAAYKAACREMLKRTGLKTITDASVSDLERYIRIAREWKAAIMRGAAA